VHIAEVDSGHEVASLSGHPGPVRCVQFNPVKMLVASACTKLAFWIPDFKDSGKESKEGREHKDNQSESKAGKDAKGSGASSLATPMDLEAASFGGGGAGSGFGSGGGAGPGFGSGFASGQ
jgi:hypothetical protein